MLRLNSLFNYNSFFLMALIFLLLAGCSENSVGPPPPPETESPLVGSWIPSSLDKSSEFNHALSFSLEQGEFTIKNRNDNTTQMYKLFEWEVIVPGKFMRITLLRHIESGTEHPVAGNQEIVDYTIYGGKLYIFDDTWIRKN